MLTFDLLFVFLQESTSKEVKLSIQTRPNKLHYVNVLEKIKTRYCKGKRENRI